MAMSDARDYVLAIESNKDEAAAIAKSSANSMFQSSTNTTDYLILTIMYQELEDRQITLIDLVQSLGDYINDEDVSIRTRAISYLVAVLSFLPTKFLSRQQIQVLNQFLCDRIQDGGAIEGLSQLQGLDRFTTDMAQTVVRA